MKKLVCRTLLALGLSLIWAVPSFSAGIENSGYRIAQAEVNEVKPEDVKGKPEDAGKEHKKGKRHHGKAKGKGHSKKASKKSQENL